MLQVLRHQTKPIMITVAVIIIVSFIFWGGYTRGDHNPQEGTVLTVLGKEYTYPEVQRIQGTYRIARQLNLPGSEAPYFSYLYDIVFLKFNYGSQQTGRPLEVADAPVDYATNVLVLRQALKDYGIMASDSEVQEVFRGLPSFQINGQFDRDLAHNFEKSLGDRGLQLADVYEVIRDSIGLQKLQKLVGGNLVIQPKAAAEFYTSGSQTMKVASIPFPLEEFKKTAKATDDEVSKYFEENKDKYQSLERRAVSHALIAKPNTEGKNAEETVKIEKAHMDKLVNLSKALSEPKADFEALVKAAGYEVKTVPAFSPDAPPEEFKEEFELLRTIFTNNPQTRPVSDPIEVKKGYEIIKVTDIKPPGQQEFAEVKDKVREHLVEQKASEAMQKAANEAKKSLEEAIKAGKKYEDAAKEAKLVPQMLAEFSPRNPPNDLSNGYEISRAAMDVPAGAFTKPLSTENGVILIYVISKNLYKSEDSATRKKTLAGQLEQNMQSEMFHAWFEKRYDEATIVADPLLRIASASSR